MFSWICPTCGKEVPPSKTECPFCAERAQKAAAAGYPVPGQAYPAQPQPYAAQPPAGYAPQPTQSSLPTGQMPAWQPPQPPPPPPPVYAAPPQYAQPQPQYAPQPTHTFPAQGFPAPQQPYSTQGLPPSAAPAAWPVQPARSGPPTWAMGLGFAAVFIVILGGVYFWMNGSGGSAPASSAKTGADNSAALKKDAGGNPLSRQVEVTGLRFTTENKNPAIRFVVVNHSGSDIDGLAAAVTLSAGTNRSDEDSIGSFRFTLEGIKAGESKDMSAPLTTKLRAYELPDWQNATAEVSVTSPAP